MRHPGRLPEGGLGQTPGSRKSDPVSDGQRDEGQYVAS